MLGTHLSAEACARLKAQAANTQESLLHLDRARMAADYNRRSFLVQHALIEHPAFQLGPLVALCQRLPPTAVKFRVGEVPHDAHFDTSLARYRGELTLEAAIGQLESRGAYIAVYNPEQDPLYAPAIERIIGDIAQATDGLEVSINWYSTYIFISTQDALTPYHMDREMNFLLQIRGTKNAQLWDPNDDRVMSPRERDHLFSHGEDARPTWRPELAALAMSFDLVPGLGVHHPFIAPHLVRTGPELSVSLAVTFRTPASDARSDVHRFNERVLRRLGLPARRAGDAGPWVEGAKVSAIRALQTARRVLKRGNATA